jgi:hypothetical protein
MIALAVKGKKQMGVMLEVSNADVIIARRVVPL